MLSVFPDFVQFYTLTRRNGGLFDFRVTPNPNLFWMFNLDVEFDNIDSPVTGLVC